MGKLGTMQPLYYEHTPLHYYWDLILNFITWQTIFNCFKSKITGLKRVQVLKYSSEEGQTRFGGNFWMHKSVLPIFVQIAPVQPLDKITE